MTFKDTNSTSALINGFNKSFNASMNGNEYRPSLEESTIRITSSEIQTYNDAGIFLGRIVADNIKLAISRNELHEFILKEMAYGIPEKDNHYETY